MANIVSMKSVSQIKGARVTMDTAHGMNIIVILADGSIFNFKPYENGLYYFDLDTVAIISKPKETVTNYSFLQTVKEKNFFLLFRKLKERICQELCSSTYTTQALEF